MGHGLVHEAKSCVCTRVKHANMSSCKWPLGDEGGDGGRLYWGDTREGTEPARGPEAEEKPHKPQMSVLSR